jgi:uncharacterized membrane protein YkoI
MTRTGLLAPLFVVALMGIAGCEHMGVFEPFREVECLERASVSLEDAIAAAEASGGKALDADYREEEEMGCLTNNPGVYDITLFADGKINSVSVDARSRQVGPREEESVMNQIFSGGGRFEGSPVDMAHMLPSLAIDISQAISIAKRQGGKAMSAWIEAKDGKLGYTVKIVQNGRVQVTWVEGEKPA